MGQMGDINVTRPRFDKVKPKGWFKYSLQIDWGVLWDWNAGILIKVQQLSLMMFSLNMVDYPMSFLLLSTWDLFDGQLEGTNLRCSYSYMLKSCGVVGGG